MHQTTQTEKLKYRKANPPPPQKKTSQKSMKITSLYKSLAKLIIIFNNSNLVEGDH